MENLLDSIVLNKNPKNIEYYVDLIPDFEEQMINRLKYHKDKIWEATSLLIDLSKEKDKMKPKDAEDSKNYLMSKKDLHSTLKDSFANWVNLPNSDLDFPMSVSHIKYLIKEAKRKQ